MYTTAFDLKKSYDMSNHFKLFSSLIDSGVPIPVINVVRIDVLNYLLLYDGTVPFPIRFQLAVV